MQPPLLQPILCLSFNPLSQQPNTSPHKAKPLSLPSLLLRWTNSSNLYSFENPVELLFFQSSGEASSSSDSDTDEEGPSRSSTKELPPSFSCVKLSQVPSLMEWRSLWSNEATFPKIPFVLLFLIPLFPLSLPIYLCACLLCIIYIYIYILESLCIR